MRRLVQLLALAAVAQLAAPAAAAQWSTQALSQGRRYPAAVSSDGKAFFAGGRQRGMPSDVVDIYDDASGGWSTAALSVPRSYIAATAVGRYVLFAGGSVNSTTDSAVVDVLDLQTMTWSVAALSQARGGAAATTVGGKAIIAGGGIGGWLTPVVTDVVDIYDAALGPPQDPAAWSTTTLSAPRGLIAAATAGNRALFAGGQSPATFFDVVDIYDASSGQWSVEHLSQARLLETFASASTGSRACFGGGEIGSQQMSDVVDIYDAPSGTWSTAKLSAPRGAIAATAVGNVVLFAGGWTAGYVTSDVVDVLNVGTGVWAAQASLVEARTNLGATTVGGKALFAGGSSAPGIMNAQVDVYEPVGSNICGATANSTGCAATIAASGSAGLAANDLVLSTVCVPDGPFLYFHGGAQQQIPFANGYLCLAGTVVRMVPGGTASGGLAVISVDLPAAGITTPGARYFQCWFRDPAGGGWALDTSDALKITFQP